MKIVEFLNSEITNTEFYGAKKPKFNKEERSYFFENDSLVSLSTFDYAKSLTKFFETIVKEHLVNHLDSMQAKDYTNGDNFTGFIYLDENTNLNYAEKLNEVQASLGLLEAPSLSFSYIIIKLENVDGDELLIFNKLKSPIKVENNQFFIKPENYEVKINKDGMLVDNFPSFTLDLSLISFFHYKDDFYILDKELYQKYFNLETYYQKEASDKVYNNEYLISDGEILTKSNSKFVYEYFDNVDSFIQQIEDGQIDKEHLKMMIDNLNLKFDYIVDSGKFLVKTPKDLVDLILLSSGCIGINTLTNQPFKVKKPNYLDEE